MLQSTIRRDGVKVYYLHVPEEVEAKRKTWIEEQAERVWKKILPLCVRKINRSNQRKIK